MHNVHLAFCQANQEYLYAVPYPTQNKHHGFENQGGEMFLSEITPECYEQIWNHAPGDYIELKISTHPYFIILQSI
jgi:hypothetical protein